MFSCGGCGGQSNSANHNSPLLYTGRRFTKPNQLRANWTWKNERLASSSISFTFAWIWSLKRKKRENVIFLCPSRRTTCNAAASAKGHLAVHRMKRKAWLAVICVHNHTTLEQKIFIADKKLHHQLMKSSVSHFSCFWTLSPLSRGPKETASMSGATLPPFSFSHFVWMAQCRMSHFWINQFVIGHSESQGPCSPWLTALNEQVHVLQVLWDKEGVAHRVVHAQSAIWPETTLLLTAKQCNVLPICFFHFPPSSVKHQNRMSKEPKLTFLSNDYSFSPVQVCPLCLFVVECRNDIKEMQSRLFNNMQLKNTN